MVVFDASALLALVLGEPGSEEASRYLGEGIISTVNLAEVMSTLAQRGATEARLDALLAKLPLKIVDFTTADARQAALLRPATRSLGLSLGDRACLAVSILRGATALTADRAWGQLPEKLGTDVIVIR